jgi:hypothetical protein
MEKLNRLKDKLELLENQWSILNNNDPKSRMVGRLEMEIHNLIELIKVLEAEEVHNPTNRIEDKNG